MAGFRSDIEQLAGPLACVRYSQGAILGQMKGHFNPPGS